jgi:hypothetical protein
MVAHTLVVSLVVLYNALLAAACPAQMMNIVVEQVFLLVGLITLVALRPSTEPRISHTSTTILHRSV